MYILGQEDVSIDVVSFTAYYCIIVASCHFYEQSEKHQFNQIIVVMKMCKIEAIPIFGKDTACLCCMSPKHVNHSKFYLMKI